jgi:hypothetical protein
MNEMFVMKRANGDLFTKQIDGRLRLPVWSSREAVARYRARNPELFTFLPTHLDRRLMQRFDKAAPPELFLLSGDAHDAYLTDGRPILPEEIFSDEVASQSTRA